MEKTKQQSIQKLPSRILGVLLLITGVLLLTHLGLQYLNLEVYHQQHGQVYELSNRLDMDDEISVPTWYAQALFIMFGCLALLCGYLESSRAKKRLWYLFGVISLAFSVDEGAGLHEFFLQTLHVIFYGDASAEKSSNAWLIVLPFIVMAGIGLAYAMWRLVPKRTTILMVIAGLMFISGAVFIDMYTSVVERESFYAQGTLVAIEETAELVGTSLAIYAVANYLTVAHRRKIEDTLSALQSGKS